MKGTFLIMYRKDAYQELFHENMAGHDCFLIIPDDRVIDTDLDIEGWQDDPITHAMIFHRFVDMEWDRIRRIIEEELDLRGYIPLEEDD